MKYTSFMFTLSIIFILSPLYLLYFSLYCYCSLHNMNSHYYSILFCMFYPYYFYIFSLFFLFSLLVSCLDYLISLLFFCRTMHSHIFPCFLLFSFLLNLFPICSYFSLKMLTYLYLCSELVLFLSLFDMSCLISFLYLPLHFLHHILLLSLLTNSLYLILLLYFFFYLFRFFWWFTLVFPFHMPF